MAFAPSQPENVGEREFSLIADGLFNGELDERDARLAEREREQKREFDLLADEVERLRLFNEELDLRADRMDRRGRDLAHAVEMRAAELDRREEVLWNEEAAILARGQLQRGREAELAHWQSQLEAREDELATREAMHNEREAAHRRECREFLRHVTICDGCLLSYGRVRLSKSLREWGDSEGEDPADA